MRMMTVRDMLSKIRISFFFVTSLSMFACQCAHAVFTQSFAEMKTLLVGDDAHQLFDQ